MYTYSVIEIVNEEPLKIGASGSKANQTEPSKDYIPGSTIRGALIGQLIRKGVFKGKEQAILSQMACYNAYPHRDQRLFLPTPQHLRMDKHMWRQTMAVADQGHEEMSIELTNLLHNDKSNSKNALPYRFVALKDGALAGAKVAKQYRLHHNTSRKIGEQERENLFRYQAIAPGHTFWAIIKIEDSLAESITPVLDEVSRLYLGGARGSGYGLCRMRVVDHVGSDYAKTMELIGMPTGLNSERFKGTSQRTEIVITCLSDCLCRNEYGQPVNYIPPKVIEDICGESVSLCSESVYVQTGVTEGYNAKWQARYPKETTLKAGSVFKYQFERALSEKELEMTIRVLEQRLIGHRTQDGFGWIGVNVPYSKELLVREVKQPLKLQKRDTEKMWQMIKKDGQLNDVMSVLVSGLASAKKRWLNMIFLNSLTEELSKESNSRFSDDRCFVISKNLKSHQLKQMQSMLKEPLKQLRRDRDHLPEKTDDKGVIRDYEQDEEQCSIKGYHFNAILKYLYLDTNDQNKLDRPGQINFDKLTAYAQKMLASKKGKLFYPQAPYREKLFIAELLDTGLYIQHRRKEK